MRSVPRRARWAASAAAAAGLSAVLAGCVDQAQAMPECEADSRLAILAQAVPTASMVPCVQEMPAGWSFAALDVESERVRFWLNSDRGGLRAVEVELTARCDVSGATRVPSEEEGATRYRRIRSLSPKHSGLNYDVFDGGCVTYRYEFEKGLQIELLPEFDDAIALFPRDELRRAVRRDLGHDLDP